MRRSIGRWNYVWWSNKKHSSLVWYDDILVETLRVRLSHEGMENSVPDLSKP